MAGMTASRAGRILAAIYAVLVAVYLAHWLGNR